MATITQNQTYPITGDYKTIKVTWETLTTTNVDGAPFTLAGFKEELRLLDEISEDISRLGLTVVNGGKE